jgi:hypothetical protein
MRAVSSSDIGPRSSAFMFSRIRAAVLGAQATRSRLGLVRQKRRRLVMPGRYYTRVAVFPLKGAPAGGTLLASCVVASALARAGERKPKAVLRVMHNSSLSRSIG